MPKPGTAEWLALVREEIIDPGRPIIDPHHHLWRRPNGSYLIEDLWSDTSSGHNIVKTVFVECGAEYLPDGPEHLRCLGETQFVAEQAALSRSGDHKAAEIAGIVARADLTLTDQVVEVLEAHTEAGQGLFRGIRHSGALDPQPEALTIPGRALPDLYSRDDFRAGMRVLGRMGLTYDTWHYHHQNAAFAELARAVPDTQMILDHFGTPLGVGSYAGKRDEILDTWQRDILEISRCENVVAKIGGLAMPDNGFGWDKADLPPTSDEFVEAQRRYYLHTIECFGPDRCMFESNFPVDKRSIAYPVLYNGLKKIVAEFSEGEKDQMFYGTAARIYKLD